MTCFGQLGSDHSTEGNRGTSLCIQQSLRISPPCRSGVLLGKRIQDVAATIAMSEFLGWRNSAE
jgi:hypothetical protein